MAQGQNIKKNETRWEDYTGTRVSAVSPRSILLGAVLAFLLNFFDAYATTMIRGSYLSLNFSTPATLFFFFFVVMWGG